MLRIGLVLALGLLVVPLAAEAQPSHKVPVVGMLTPASGPSPLFDAFRLGLRELGYVEDRNIVIEYRFARGDLEALPGLAMELVRLPADVIVTDGTAAALAAKRATDRVPIVMAAISDPVRSGIIPSLARPGGNVTGLTLLAPELSAKRLELLRAVLGPVRQIAAVWVAGNPNGELPFAETEAAGRSLGINVHPLKLGSVDDLEPMIRSAAGRVRAVVQLSDVLLWNNRAAVVRVAASYRLPAIYEAREFCEAGGLMSYGLSLPESFRRAAGYVDRILKGAKPADLPVEQPTKFELVINLKTAKALGVTIPQSLLLRADQVIQ